MKKNRWRQGAASVAAAAVLWLAAGAGADAEALARNLGFVRPGRIEED